MSVSDSKRKKNEGGKVDGVATPGALGTTFTRQHVDLMYFDLPVIIDRLSLGSQRPSENKQQTVSSEYRQTTIYTIPE